jgi:hypothetical protein
MPLSQVALITGHIRNYYEKTSIEEKEKIEDAVT